MKYLKRKQHESAMKASSCESKKCAKELKKLYEKTECDENDVKCRDKSKKTWKQNFKKSAKCSKTKCKKEFKEYDDMTQKFADEFRASKGMKPISWKK